MGEAFLSASFRFCLTEWLLRRWSNSSGKETQRRAIQEVEGYVVVNDAEEKKMGKPTVRAWLLELQAAICDAEDLVQMINTEALRCKKEGEHGSSSSNQVVNLFTITAASFNELVELKMKDIFDAFEFVFHQKFQLGLRKRCPKTPNYMFMEITCNFFCRMSLSPC